MSLENDAKWPLHLPCGPVDSLPRAMECGAQGGGGGGQRQTQDVKWRNRGSQQESKDTQSISI